MTIDSMYDAGDCRARRRRGPPMHRASNAGVRRMAESGRGPQPRRLVSVRMAQPGASLFPSSFSFLFFFFIVRGRGAAGRGGGLR